MAQHFRYDTDSFVPGKFCYRKAPGLGYLGSEIPSTGEHGPSIYYPSLQPGDMDVEIYGRLVSRPSAGRFRLYEDGSFVLSDAPDGTYFAEIELFRIGVSQGVITATFHVNDDMVVASNFSGAYSIVGTVQKAFNAAYGIAQAVQSDFDGAYTVVGRVTKNLDGTFNVVGRVVKNFDGEFQVLADGVVVSSFDANYNVLGSVQRSFDAAYGVTAAVARSASFSYGIREAVSADFEGAYGVTQAVQATFDGTYAIRSAVTRSFTGSYAVQGETGPCPTADQIADAVWSRLLTGARIPGSAGSMMQDVSARVAASL